MSTLEDIKIGSKVTFVGFEGDEVPDLGEALEVGAQYKVTQVEEDEDGQVFYALEAPNPDFDLKRKISKVNPEFVYVSVLDNEIEAAVTLDDYPEITPEDLVIGQVIEVEDDEDEPLIGVLKGISKKDITVEVENGDAVIIKLSSIQAIRLVEPVEVEEKSTKSPKGKAKVSTPSTGKAKAEAVSPEIAKSAGKVTPTPVAPKKKVEKAEAEAKQDKSVKNKPAAKAAKEKVVEPEVVKRGRGRPPLNRSQEGSQVDPDLKGMLLLTEEEEDQEIVQLVNESEDICALAEELAQQTSRDEYTLGGILYHIRLTKRYKEIAPEYAEVKGFETYVQEQLRMGYRKAMYLIDIYAKFNKYGLASDKVQAIGWTKAQKIAQQMNEENAEELFELAQTMSVAELGTEITERYKRVGADDRPRVKFTTIKFRMQEEEAEYLKNFLEQGAIQLEEKKLEKVFYHIVNEWAMEHLNIQKPEKASGRKSK